MNKPFFTSYAGFSAVVLANIAAVFLSWRYFDYTGYDMRILVTWVGHIREQGVTHAYGKWFAIYAPLYTYFIGIETLLFPDMQAVHMVKWLSIFGDAVAAYFVYAIMRDFAARGRLLPFIAGACVFACPSVVSNGAAIGQCDIGYSAFVLATVYALMKQRPLRAMVYFGIAFSLKQQALFLAPFLLICLLRRLIPWTLAWVPAGVYIITLLPAWAQGRSFVDLLLVYFHQFSGQRDLGDGGDIYLLLQNFPYEIVAPIGLCFAALWALVFSLYSARYGQRPFTPYHLLLLATLSTAMMPFLLPKMHERYFFAADICALALAFMRPRLALVFVLLQCGEVINIWDQNFEYINDWTGLSQGTRRWIAGGLNLGAIGLLCFSFYTDIIRGKEQETGKALW